MSASAGIQRIAVLGSTGSIGTSCLDVLDGMRDRTEVFGLTAHRRWKDLANRFHGFIRGALSSVTRHSRKTVIPKSAFGSQLKSFSANTRSSDWLPILIVDTVVAGIVGAAGLRGTWAAIETGKRVCLANKETLVVAGPLVMALARQRGATIIPVDSEHSAVFQALQSGTHQRSQAGRLTASGGPFRTWDAQQLQGCHTQTGVVTSDLEYGPQDYH
jgi:1-deoxy-D-xylulose-5-phosphate reductoisomerase